ncbi:hypothetical protein G5B37_12780 [Rasiella rasia]|uniref:SIR2-like domain-containing protein n=1 Tax=Rasiella rasia TaxID=2744027 RepID=A0A6G6GPK0_9FLAO|nr:hypothetical protein [Rasiella rasia]QIE60404.1 hypothetical protein G5B37_12780 [Rasiella rasia]
MSLKFTPAFLRALQDGEVILVLGAGFNANLTNKSGERFPLGEDLKCAIVDRYNNQVTTRELDEDSKIRKYERLDYSISLQEASQRLIDLKGSEMENEKWFNDYLTLDLKQERLKLYNALQNIPWKQIFTFNYDNVLSLCLPFFKDNSTGYGTGSPAPAIQGVHYLNGKLPMRILETELLQARTNLKLTKRDYYVEDAIHQDSMSIFQHNIQHYHVIYLGFAGDEPSWERLKANINEYNVRPKSFYLTPNKDLELPRQLVDYGVAPMLGDTDKFLEFCKDFKKTTPEIFVQNDFKNSYLLDAEFFESVGAFSEYKMSYLGEVISHNTNFKNRVKFNNSDFIVNNGSSVVISEVKRSGFSDFFDHGILKNRVLIGNSENNSQKSFIYEVIDFAMESKYVAFYTEDILELQQIEWNYESCWVFVNDNSKNVNDVTISKFFQSLGECKVNLVINKYSSYRLQNIFDQKLDTLTYDLHEFTIKFNVDFLSLLYDKIGRFFETYDIKLTNDDEVLFKINNNLQPTEKIYGLIKKYRDKANTTVPFPKSVAIFEWEKCRNKYNNYIPDVYDLAAFWSCLSTKPHLDYIIDYLNIADNRDNIIKALRVSGHFEIADNIDANISLKNNRVAKYYIDNFYSKQLQTKIVEDFMNRMRTHRPKKFDIHLLRNVFRNKWLGYAEELKKWRNANEEFAYEKMKRYTDVNPHCPDNPKNYMFLYITGDILGKDKAEDFVIKIIDEFPLNSLHGIDKLIKIFIDKVNKNKSIEGKKILLEKINDLIEKYVSLESFNDVVTRTYFIFIGQYYRYFDKVPNQNQLALIKSTIIPKCFVDIRLLQSTALWVSIQHRNYRSDWSKEFHDYFLDYPHWNEVGFKLRMTFFIGYVLDESNLDFYLRKFEITSFKNIPIFQSAFFLTRMLKYKKIKMARKLINLVKKNNLSESDEFVLNNFEARILLKEVEIYFKQQRASMDKYPTIESKNEVYKGVEKKVSRCQYLLEQALSRDDANVRTIHQLYLLHGKKYRFNSNSEDIDLANKYFWRLYTINPNTKYISGAIIDTLMHDRSYRLVQFYMKSLKGYKRIYYLQKMIRISFYRKNIDDFIKFKDEFEKEYPYKEIHHNLPYKLNWLQHDKIVPANHYFNSYNYDILKRSRYSSNKELGEKLICDVYTVDGKKYETNIEILFDEVNYMKLIEKIIKPPL